MSIISDFQLRDYNIELLHIEANPSFKENPNHNYKSGIGFDFHVEKQKDKPLFLLKLKVNLNSSKIDFENSPYKIQVILSSIFEISNVHTDDETTELIGLNGLAMMYSIVRGIVSQTTASSLHGKFILPTVNFYDVVSKRLSDGKTKQEKKSKSNSHKKKSS